MFMATISTTKLLLLLCLFALLPLAMEMMPLQAQSAGTICGAVIALVYMVCENYYLLPFYCKMAVFKKGQKIRHMMKFGFIIKLVCCLGWLCGLAFGQAGLSDAITGSVTFPALGITCLGNLAVFHRCIWRGPPKLDIGAKDVLTTVTAQKLKKINELEDHQRYEGEGLTTCSNDSYCDVLMLSKQVTPNSSMKQFMEYMSNVHDADSIFLTCRPPPENCTCMKSAAQWSTCRCIVFDTLKDITKKLARRMPGKLKRLSDSQCLLLCEECLGKGCHDCDEGLLHLEYDELRDGPHEKSPAAVCNLLAAVRDDCIICIPLYSASDDVWTRQLITVLELKGTNVREVNSALKNYIDGSASSALKNHIAGSASSALKNYIAGNGECDSREDYNIVSLVIVPTLTEVLINIALTFWFKADGFSSARVARTAMEDYILPGHSGGGFSPAAFLTSVRVKSDQNNSSVCQVLSFRGSPLNLRPLNFLMDFVNLICSVSWIVLVALEGGANKWYHTYSMPLSKARVIVIIIAIGISLGISLSHWLLYESDRRQIYTMSHFKPRRGQRYMFIMICMIVLDILCIVPCSIVLGTVGMKVFGRWLYAALQCLVWIKWGIANYLTAQFSDSEVTYFGDYIDGRYLYASPFFLNAILAGVRAKWEL